MDSILGKGLTISPCAGSDKYFQLIFLTGGNPFRLQATMDSIKNYHDTLGKMISAQPPTPEPTEPEMDKPCTTTDCSSYNKSLKDHCAQNRTARTCPSGTTNQPPTPEPPKIMCDDHRDEKLEVFERTPGVFSVLLCECCMSAEKHAGFVDAEMEYKVGAYEEESTDEPPPELGWNKLKCPVCGGPGGLIANGIDYHRRICQNKKCSLVNWEISGQWQGPPKEPK